MGLLKGVFMKKQISMMAFILVSSLMMMGCTPEKSSNPAPTTPSCPAGSTYNNGVCVAANGTVTQPGTTGTTGGAVRFFTENWNVRNMEVPVTAYTAYTNFIQNAMGVCGPYTSTGIDCSEWVSGAMDIVLMADNVQANQATLVFRLKPRGYGPQFPPRVLPLNFTLSVTNNYQGFEGRAYGDYGSPSNRSLIQLQVAVGKLQDESLEYRMAYRGEVIFVGRLQKCSLICGLDKNIGL